MKTKKEENLEKVLKIVKNDAACRLQIYKLMLERAERWLQERERYFFCHSFNVALEIVFKKLGKIQYYTDDIENALVEMRLFKPKEMWSTWVEDVYLVIWFHPNAIQKRIDILIQIIGAMEGTD